MKNYIKWGTLAIVIVLVIGGVVLFVTKLLSSSDNVVEDTPTAAQQAILDVKFNEPEPLLAAQVDSPDSLYNTLHQMANTKIVAEDGQIWGLQPITKSSVEGCQKAAVALKINDSEINNMLNRWAQQDYSHSVEDHNYIWKTFLHGEIGKAIRLR